MSFFSQINEILGSVGVGSLPGVLWDIDGATVTVRQDGEHE